MHYNNDPLFISIKKVLDGEFYLNEYENSFSIRKHEVCYLCIEKEELNVEWIYNQLKEYQNTVDILNQRRMLSVAHNYKTLFKLLQPVLRSYKIKNIEDALSD